MLNLYNAVHSYSNTFDGLEPLLAGVGMQPVMFSEYNSTIISMCRNSESLEFMTKTADSIDKTSPVFHELQKIQDTATRACKLNYTKLVNLYKQYQTALIQRGHFPNPSTFDNLSIIDASKILAIRNPVSDNDELEESVKLFNEIENFGNTVKFCGIIPCFDHGVMRLDGSVVVKWDVKNLDLDKNDITLYVYAWIPKGTIDLDFDIPYAEFTATLHYNTVGEDLVETTMVGDISIITMLDMFQMISPKQMKWSKDDRMLWNRVYVRFAKLVDTLSEKKAPYGSCAEIIDNMIFGFLGTNYFLHKNRQPISRSVSPDPVILCAFDQEKQDQRRTIDVSMTIATESDARSISKSRDVICYQVASWGCRGHIRHYKDGKMIWVKPHVRHRRCMEEIANVVAPAPTTITVNDSEEGELKYG